VHGVAIMRQYSANSTMGVNKPPITASKNHQPSLALAIIGQGDLRVPSHTEHVRRIKLTS
jgi:hypothetical protein